ncbi:hypothetical protein [uncultured Merdimonas sp.]|uniref:hypothetical protein n=1 Tax=uncultured Merdimonas sp. TaxID=2023269 RepID=UPI00320AA6C8
MTITNPSKNASTRTTSVIVIHATAAYFPVSTARLSSMESVDTLTSKTPSTCSPDGS